MKLRNLACIAVALSLPHAHADPATNDETLVEQVRCVEIAFAESVANRDADTFRSLVHPDARFVGSGVARGRDAIVAAWAPLFEQDRPLLTWRPQIVEVLEAGNLALSRGPYRLQMPGADGDTVEEWGTYNSIWQRADDGTWQIVFDAGSHAAVPAETRALIEDAAPPCATSR